jgi:hypothetical protein
VGFDLRQRFASSRLGQTSSARPFSTYPFPSNGDVLVVAGLAFLGGAASLPVGEGHRLPNLPARRALDTLSHFVPAMATPSRQVGGREFTKVWWVRPAVIEWTGGGPAWWSGPSRRFLPLAAASLTPPGLAAVRERVAARSRRVVGPPRRADCVALPSPGSGGVLPGLPPNTKRPTPRRRKPRNAGLSVGADDGAQPARPGLGSQTGISAVGPRWFEKPLVMRVCRQSREPAPHGYAVSFRSV